MKNVCWALFGLSVLLFLLGVVSKFVGGDGGDFPLRFAPVAWWRAAMAALLYAIGLKILGENGRTA